MNVFICIGSRNQKYLKTVQHSKIYNSLVVILKTRTPPTASSGSGSVKLQFSSNYAGDGERFLETFGSKSVSVVEQFKNILNVACPDIKVTPIIT